MINLAKTTAWLANMPMSPGQYLVAVIEGVWITNSSVLLSKVAVVSRAATFDPWPSSV